MTENTCYTLTETFESKEDTKKITEGKVPIGNPIPNNHVYIVDKELNLVPAGQTGEIAVSGFNVACGYLHDAKAGVFITNPFSEIDSSETLLLTSDYGSIANGRVFFEGRESTRVIIRGYRVSSVEVEQVMSELGEVKKAAVVVYSADTSTDDVVIVGYYISETNISASEMTRHLKEHLPEYAVPRVICLDEMPVRSPSGKVDYPALLASFADDVKTSTRTFDTGLDLRGIVNKQIAAALQINEKDLSLESNFFDMGGNSLNVSQLWNALVDRHIDVSITDILHAQSIQDIIDLCCNSGTKMNNSPPDHPPYYVVEKLHESENEMDAAMVVAIAYGHQRNPDIKIVFPFTVEQGKRIILPVLPLSRKDNLSLCITDTRTQKAVSTSILTSINPDVSYDDLQNASEKLKTWDETNLSLILASEGPFITEDKENNYRTLWATRFGVDPEVRALDAPILVNMMLEASVEVARREGFDKLHLTTVQQFVKVSTCINIISTIHSNDI